jgi:NADH:ubiquinone oxidoreductase subunit 4 (subunit M)
MAARIGNFLIFIILTIFTLGLYPLFFFVSRQQETVELLQEIKKELQK